MSTCITKILTLCSTRCSCQKRSRRWTSTHAGTARRTSPGCQNYKGLHPHRTCIYLTCGSQRSTRRVTRHRESRDDTPTRTDDHTQLTTSTQIAYRHQPRLIVPPTIILILPSICRTHPCC